MASSAIGNLRLYLPTQLSKYQTKQVWGRSTMTQKKDVGYHTCYSLFPDLQQYGSEDIPINLKML